MFLGTYYYQADNNNRIRLPKNLKSQISENEQLLISKGFEGCLFVMTLSSFKNKIISQFDKSSALDPEMSKCATMLLSATENFVSDAQGRFSIPANLMQYANIEKDIAILGAGDRIEIWNADSWQAKVKDFDNNFDKNFKNAVEVLNKYEI